jgi:hypothetical protein
VAFWRRTALRPELAADGLELLLCIAVKERIPALVGELLSIELRISTL